MANETDATSIACEFDDSLSMVAAHKFACPHPDDPAPYDLRDTALARQVRRGGEGLGSVSLLLGIRYVHRYKVCTHLVQYQ